jgi:hypothetical protein
MIDWLVRHAEVRTLTGESYRTPGSPGTARQGQPHRRIRRRECDSARPFTAAPARPRLSPERLEPSPALFVGSSNK